MLDVSFVWELHSLYTATAEYIFSSLYNPIFATHTSATILWSQSRTTHCSMCAKTRVTVPSVESKIFMSNLFLSRIIQYSTEITSMLMNNIIFILNFLGWRLLRRIKFLSVWSTGCTSSFVSFRFVFIVFHLSLL